MADKEAHLLYVYTLLFHQVNQSFNKSEKEVCIPSMYVCLLPTPIPSPTHTHNHTFSSLLSLYKMSQTQFNISCASVVQWLACLVTNPLA